VAEPIEQVDTMRARIVELESTLRSITDARQADGEKIGVLAATLRRCLAQLNCYEWRGAHGTCIWCMRDEHAADCSHIEAMKAGWKALGEHPCPKCARPMEVRPGMFFWRGRHFSGLVCAPCKSLWNNPDDSFEAAVGPGVRS
jgi:hypothetical protein